MSTASPSVRSAGGAGSRDGLRRAVLAVSAVLAVAGSAVGSGALGGTPVAQAAGGALSASATLVAPDGPAFAVWGVVYAGLLALAVLQLLPARAHDARQRATGWWVTASLLLNLAWILTVQAGRVAASVVVIAALLVVLVVTFGRLLGTAPTGPVEAVVVDGTVGLYLGWVSVATVANTAAALKQAGLTTAEPAWAVGVLALAGAVG
ncbi:tryptophan-rich sensory protein, partial [Kineococcus indalonis]|uniref:tryptophan-rich sensory protein n=1 Tax=Kineococcus indalonis TaxID=2696566 RepID=UPI001412F19E